MVGTFTAQVEAFVAKSRMKMELVFKESARDVFDAAQLTKASEAKRPRKNVSRGFARGGNLPVDTEFLLKSMVSGLNGQTGAGGADSYVMAIAGAKIGDTVFGGWTAKYARHVEYGTSKMAGSFFALKAAQQWQAIVSKNAAKAKNL